MNLQIRGQIYNMQAKWCYGAVKNIKRGNSANPPKTPKINGNLSPIWALSGYCYMKPEKCPKLDWS